MNSVTPLLQKYFSQAALSGYLLAFVVWVLYNNVLRNLLGSLCYPSYKWKLSLNAVVCKILDPAPVISFFLWFTLLKLGILITLFLLLKTKYLKVFHEPLTYLLTIELTVCVLYFILQILSLVYPFHVNSFFFAASPFHFFFWILKMDPWPAFALIGFVSGFLLNRLGLFSKKDIIKRIALTVLSFMLYVLQLRLVFGHW